MKILLGAALLLSTSSSAIATHHVLFQQRGLLPMILFTGFAQLVLPVAFMTSLIDRATVTSEQYVTPVSTQITDSLNLPITEPMTKQVKPLNTNLFHKATSFFATVAEYHSYISLHFLSPQQPRYSGRYDRQESK